MLVVRPILLVPHLPTRRADEPKQDPEGRGPISSDDLPAPELAEPIEPQCSIEDFMKVDLRVAKIVKAETVEGADKLLHLELDIGGLKKDVFAGIAKAYRPEELVDKIVICVANLKPRKMKFGTSEGMILAAGPGGSDLFMLKIDDGAKPGQRVH